MRGGIGYVREWFRWLVKRGLTANNPAADLDLPRLPRRLPLVILTPAQVEQILALADIARPLGLRDRALMEVLWSTGIRRTEVRNLNACDVRGDQGTLLIHHGKGGRDRVVPIGERALGWIERYRRESRPLLHPPEDESALFVSISGARLACVTIGETVAQYIRAAKLESVSKGACHLFRHSMATAMLERGCDVRFLQAILGHELLSTTATYTHVAIDQLRRVHAATHPAAGAPIRRRATVLEATAWLAAPMAPGE